MSLRQMIALHPNERDHVNQPLADAVHHLMYCAKMCASCADACLAEAMDRTQCSRVCLDCEDVCEATGRLALRRTGENSQAVREMLELCARTCDACAAECENACPMRLKPRDIKRHMFNCTECGQCLQACEQVQAGGPGNSGKGNSGKGNGKGNGRD